MSDGDWKQMEEELMSESDWITDAINMLVERADDIDGTKLNLGVDREQNIWVHTRGQVEEWLRREMGAAILHCHEHPEESEPEAPVKVSHFGGKVPGSEKYYPVCWYFGRMLDYHGRLIATLDARILSESPFISLGDLGSTPCADCEAILGAL